MNRRRRTNGAKRIVRHEVNVMRLGPSRDLHGFGQAAYVAHVNADEIGEPALDIGYKSPFAGEFLADGKGNMYHLAQGCVCLRRLVTNGLFDEVKRTGWHALAKRCRFRHV